MTVPEAQAKAARWRDWGERAEGAGWPAVAHYCRGMAGHADRAVLEARLAEYRRPRRRGVSIPVRDLDRYR